jgi:hypothetical protein
LTLKAVAFEDAVTVALLQATQSAVEVAVALATCTVLFTLI